MRTETQPFTWSEDLDETLNFWFWLRRSGGIEDAELRLRVELWAGLRPYAGNLAAADHPRFREYLSVGQDWRWTWVHRTMDGARSEGPRAYRARFKAIKSTGVKRSPTPSDNPDAEQSGWGLENRDVRPYPPHIARD